MKILQINKYFYLKGGAETVFFNTIDLLKRNGHKVIPFCLNNPKNRESEFDSYFVNYPELSECNLLQRLVHIPDFIYNKEAAQKLEKLIIEQRPDLAHIHLLFNSHSVSILPVLKKYNIPTIMTVHDYRLICPAYAFRDGKGNICEKCLYSKSYYNCILKRCSKNNLGNSIILTLDSYFRSAIYKPIDYINKFIFVSQFSRNKHIEADQRYKDKSTFLYNFTPHIYNAKKERGKYLLFFGRISEEKGINTLIDAIKNIPDMTLKIAGTGPLYNSLSHLNIPNVELLGFKQGKELEDLVQNAMYVIVSSECYENNPLSIIEAMAMGIPVIGSNIGGIPELINNEKNGFLFETKNAHDLESKIQKALAITDHQYFELSQNAFSFAKANFSEEAHYQKLISVYNSVL